MHIYLLKIKKKEKWLFKYSSKEYSNNLIMDNSIQSYIIL